MVSTPTRTPAAKPPHGHQCKNSVSRAAAPKSQPPQATGPAAKRRHPRQVRGWFRGFWSALEGTGKSRNGSTYYLILGSTLALTAIGIMMVLSASSVEAIAAGKSPYSAALKQGMFAAIGLFCMFLLSRVNVVWLKRFAWLAIRPPWSCWCWSCSSAAAPGNQNWIDVGPFTFQPRRPPSWPWPLDGHRPRRQGQAPQPVQARPDSGGTGRRAGDRPDPGWQRPRHRDDRYDHHRRGAVLRRVPLYVFGIGAFLGAATTVLAITSPNRVCRILSWTGQTCADGSDLNYQSTNGLYGLASGGWFGVGLGQSRQKYSWIPEAHNDFIFAIIGEELGLIGTLVVLVLFAILGTAIYRVVVAQKDMFHRVLAGTIMVWLLGQATVNMAVVTGLAPVVGIPLPFISYGGSALLMSLCAIGVVLSLARAQMAPGMQPKGLFRFGPAGLARSLRKSAAARTAARNGAAAPGEAAPKSTVPKDAAPKSPAPQKRRTQIPAPKNPARKRK